MVIKTQMRYLYPKTTDFIFAVVSEEMGFIVASVVIILYVYLLLRMIKIAKEVKEPLASMLICRNNWNIYISYDTKTLE